MQEEVIVRWLGMQDYLQCWDNMRTFTQGRNHATPDEIWLLEHPAVYTQGQNGKPQHLLNKNNIPVIQIDRGGQITYHGPGQLIVYTLIDLQRKKLNIRQMVTALEQSVINFLQQRNIPAESNPKAPGVYVQGKKICSIGLRIKRGCAYHGLALNVAMDLQPFSDINPCGFANLQMTQMSDFLQETSLFQKETHLFQIGYALLGYLLTNLSYNRYHFEKLGDLNAIEF